MQRFKPILAALTVSLCLGAAGLGPAAAQGTAPASTANEATAAPVEIVAFGDSLTAGYGLGPGQSFADRLQAALREKGLAVAVANAGVSGDTTSAGLARLDWSVPRSADLVILELGANDALRGISPAIAERNLDAMLARFRERGQSVVLAGMLAPRNLGPDYGREFDAIYPRLSEKYGVPLYPFFLDGVVGDPALNLDDGMHPNEKGIAIIVDRILPTVERAVEAVRSARETD